MRTTVTLDPDLAEELKGLARAHNLSFKEALNDAIRTGLAARRGTPKPYKLPSKRMGLRPGIDLTKALQMVDDLEDEERIRKLELGK